MEILNNVLVGLFVVYTLAEIGAAIYIYRNRYTIGKRVRSLLGLDIDAAARRSAEEMAEHEASLQSMFRDEQSRKINAIGSMSKKTTRTLNLLGE